MNKQLAPTAARRVPVVCAFAAALLASACGGGGSPSPSPTVSSQSSPAASTAAALTPSPTSAGTGSPPPASGSATPSASEVVAPPIAQLGPSDESGVPGHLGSWCYDGSCLDGPAPGKASLPLIDMEAGAGLVFLLAGSHPFSHGTASYAGNHDAETTQLAEVGEYYDPYVSPTTPAADLSTFSFEAPPRGDWVVRISVQFGDRGDAVYYWHVRSG